MSVGRRTSVLGTASTHILALTLLAGFLPGVKATCWVDRDGFETCDGLSNLARAMIGLAFFLVFLAVIFGLFAFRRRRNRQANMAYIQQTHRGSGAGYGGPQYGSAGGPPPFAPQYPPPAHNGLNSPYIYDPSSGFAQPSVSPPQYYPPPPGAPPISSYQK